MARAVVKQGPGRRPASPVTKVQICAAARDPVNRGAAGFRCCTAPSHSPRVQPGKRSARRDPRHLSGFLLAGAGVRPRMETERGSSDREWGWKIAWQAGPLHRPCALSLLTLLRRRAQRMGARPATRATPAAQSRKPKVQSGSQRSSRRDKKSNVSSSGRAVPRDSSHFPRKFVAHPRSRALRSEFDG